MRVLIDIDGICADLLGGFIRVARHNLGMEGLSVEKVTDFDLSTVVPRTVVDSVFSWPQFFLSLDPLPGARWAIERIAERGHEVVLITRPSDPESARDKLEWVENHLGLDHTRCFIGGDRTMVDADVLIDDRPENVKAWLRARPQAKAATIGWPYNLELEGMVGVFYAHDYRNTGKAWGDIVEAIEELEPGSPVSRGNVTFPGASHVWNMDEERGSLVDEVAGADLHPKSARLDSGKGGCDADQG